MKRRVDIDSQQVVFDDVFRIEEVFLRHSLADGSMSGRVRRLNFERGDSAAALLLNRDRQTCILAEQFRYPAFKRGQGWLLEIPAGIIEEKEAPESSIRREILEETGYRIRELIPIADFFPSPGGSSEMIRLFCAIVQDGDRIASGGGNEEEEESIQLREIRIEDIDECISNGAVLDGKTLLALTWLQLRRARGERIGGGTDEP